jgi:hypothetical protein
MRKTIFSLAAAAALAFLTLTPSLAEASWASRWYHRHYDLITTATTTQHPS